MSRLTGSDALGLFEAYQTIYAPQELTEEQVWEEVETWVNSLIEEGYDLSDYTWEEMYESYLEEAGMDVFSTPAMKKAQVNQALSVFNPQKSKPKPDAITSFTNSPAVQKAQKGREVRAAQDLFGIKQKPVTKVNPTTPTAKPTPATSTPAGRPAAATTPAARPAVAPAASAPKPAAATAPAAKPSAMDQFAKANPKLAAASAERDRTRGTSATTNPLMKDMKSRLPAPKTPSPTTAKTGFDLAKKGVNLAASFDMFDVVKGYLIGEGYADTEEAALAIMANMSEEWRESIVEERAPGVRPYKAGPTQAEVRADAKRAAKKKVEKDKDKEGYGPEEKFKDWKLTSTPSTVNKKGETISQRMDKEAPYKTRPFSPLFTKQGSRTASAVTRATEGPGEPQSVTMPRKKSKPSREIVRRNKDTNESYNIILSYLLDEGYANSVEASESIMVSMSEDWVLSIIG